MVNACGPPSGSHLLKHPGPLPDERVHPRGERLIRVDPAHQRSLDLSVPPDRLDKEGFAVGKLLPHRAQGDPCPGGNARNGRAQVTLGVQRAHRVEDRPACPVRPGGAAVGWLDIGDVFEIRVGRVRASAVQASVGQAPAGQALCGQAAAKPAFDVHQVILR